MIPTWCLIVIGKRFSDFKRSVTTGGGDVSHGSINFFHQHKGAHACTVGLSSIDTDFGKVEWTYRLPFQRCITKTYSTLRAKTGKMEEPVNRELNVTRS